MGRMTGEIRSVRPCQAEILNDNIGLSPQRRDRAAGPPLGYRPIGHRRSPLNLGQAPAAKPVKANPFPFELFTNVPSDRSLLCANTAAAAEKAGPVLKTQSSGVLYILIGHQCKANRRQGHNACAASCRLSCFIRELASGRLQF
ncbi:hypothetical protein KM043_015588 [Ampulex compressa]|nr:hypothetical protein KM043_015588 [Ampulex compressa]